MPIRVRQRSALAGRSALSFRRSVIGWLLAGVGLPLLTAGLAAGRHGVGLPSTLLLFLLLVVAVSAVGGLYPALVAAFGGSLLANWFFTPPFHTLSVRHTENVLAIVVFAVVGVVVSALVSIAERRSNDATRARSEAEAIARAASTLVGRDDPVPELLESLRESFGLEAIALLRVVASGWRVDAHAGTPCPTAPSEADDSFALSSSYNLALVGKHLSLDDRRVLETFAGPIAAGLETRRLRFEASAAQKLAAQNELRTALLAAVSHDLRTPLSSIKASVTSLLQDEVEWSPSSIDEFLRTIDEESDRLNKIVGNLLDMSRLQLGGLNLSMREVGVDEVVAASLASIGSRARGVGVYVPETLPSVVADPALLERAFANIIDNALTHGASPVTVLATRRDQTGEGKIVDHGRGIPAEERERAFGAFQRLGDRAQGVGVGLGLAVSRGFVEAMEGELALHDTERGGLTVSIRLGISHVSKRMGAA